MGSFEKMPETVYITVPKFVTISSNPSSGAIISNLTKIKPAPVEVTVMKPLASLNTMDIHDDENPSPRGKKRRLDHLTWEEKIQRKKLKNRVAAQTSRDRKKARMEEMETEIKILTEKSELLQNKCESLQSINDALLEKNRKLDMEVETLTQQLSKLKERQLNQQQENQSEKNNGKNDGENSKTVLSCVGCEAIYNGSAVSNSTDPLQKGSISQMNLESTQAKLKKSQTLEALWRIVALCLLYKTCCSSTKNSMPESLKNWPKAYLPISRQTWKLVISRAMKFLPKLQADQSDCLDQWWGPKQNAWNPANIAQNSHKVTA